MAIHMVTEIGGREFELTLSRDDAGRYVAEAVQLPGEGRAEVAAGKHVRVVDPVKERALGSLIESLRELAGVRQPDHAREGPDAPSAA
jgi:hypothetical protein